MIMARGMTSRALSLGLASLLLAACGGNVSIGGGSSNDGGAGGGGGSSGSGVPTTSPAVALTRAQMDVLWEQYWDDQDPSGSSSSSSGGDGLDPNDLFLRVSDLGVSCGSPTVDLTCGGHYHLTLVVPPALQQVGVYDLEDPLLTMYSSMTETGDPYSPQPDDCSWGGGTVGPGTLEILSIDTNEVHFTVTLGSGFWATDPSGQYVAPRCQGIL